MNIRISRWLGLLLGLFSLTIPAGLRADTVYNNISSTSNGTDPISSFGPLADSFVTGSSNFTFGSLTVLLDTTGDTGTVTASLLSNASGTPGSLIATIGTVSDSALGSSLSDVTFNLSTPITLLANTTYWIELSSTDGSSADWSFSMDQSGQGVAGQFFSNMAGVFPNVDGPYQMEVSTPSTAVPEPGTLLLLGIGIGALMYLSHKKLSVPCV